MLKNNFRIKLTMKSDWQIGTGAGIPGSVDELISKDADGFPQVPAKTLVGIWRDSLETLTLGLDNGNKKGIWSKWVETIFGNQPNEQGAEPTKKPVPAILSTQPARISENLRAQIGDDKRLKQALTFVKVGVKIDEKSGTSSTAMLRFEEMGRIDSVLEAEVECEKMNETISALLILSAKMIERIGGKRRRGAGKCKLEIVGITETEIGEAVKAIQNNKTSADQFSEVLKANFKEEENNSKWQTCEYTLTLKTPVSIVTAVLGNVSETLDFIPGTYLIGHFVKHFKQDIFGAIQDGNFQISPATICIENQRSFPVPKAFAQEKMNKDKVYNLLDDKRTPETPQTKPIREGFYVEKDDQILHATTPLTLQMHNAVDDDVQRPTTEVIGIYSREAIKAGTILKGEIRYRNLQIDFTNLKGKVRLGTSKKDSGSATIKLENAKKFEAKSGSKADKIIVYLASDVMLRNGNLRQTNLAEVLAKTLGLQGEKITFQQIQVRRIESWQTSWGFPRPTLTLMQAGSVIRFETDKTIDFAKIEAEGIGERRGEGYGRIIFNPPILNIPKPAWEKKDASKFQNSNGNGEIEDKEFAKLIEKTAWREELKIAVSKIAADDVLKKTAEEQVFGFKGLNMSQIGGLRSVIMRLQKKSDASLVTNWLDHLEQTKNRFDKWEKWRIKKVRNILAENNVWNEISGNFKTLTNLNLEHNLKDDLWAEAVKSLFYACQHAHKRDTEDK